MDFIEVVELLSIVTRLYFSKILGKRELTLSRWLTQNQQEVIESLEFEVEEGINNSNPKSLFYTKISW